GGDRLDLASEGPEDALRVLGHVDAAEPRYQVRSEDDLPLPLRLAAGDHRRARLPAAELEDHLGRGFEARQHRRRVHTALEPVARIRVDAELAAGLRRPARIEQRAFEEDVDRRLGTAGRLATH